MLVQFVYCVRAGKLFGNLLFFSLFFYLLLILLSRCCLSRLIVLLRLLLIFGVGGPRQLLTAQNVQGEVGALHIHSLAIVCVLVDDITDNAESLLF